MVDGATPKPLGDLAGMFMVLMIAGAVAIGWLNNRDRPPRDRDPSDGGALSDDGAGHHHGGWGDHAGGDGSHGGDAGGDGGGDGGH